MSVERAFRDIIREEIQVQLRPVHTMLARLQNGPNLKEVRSLVEGLKPLASMLGKGVKKKGGRPAKAVKTAILAAPQKGHVGRRATNDRPCAIIGCRRESRTKGYCAAHYQKLRMLVRTRRLPSTWTDFAAPQSVEEVVLPRGRAGAQALKATRKK